MTVSLLRKSNPLKGRRRLGEVQVVTKSEYEVLDLDAKVELILGLVPLGLRHVQDVLEQEVRELAGKRYDRKTDAERGRRYETNPGTVKIDGQRIGIRVPRVRSERAEIPLRTYQALHAGGGEVDPRLLKRVL
jgi:hypothetical protein